MEICPAGAKLIHADRRADMTKLIGVVGDCTKRPNNTNGIGIPHT
jgi:hypothetical protein